MQGAHWLITEGYQYELWEKLKKLVWRATSILSTQAAVLLKTPWNSKISLIVEVTKVDERIMTMRQKHTSSFLSLAIYILLPRCVKLMRMKFSTLNSCATIVTFSLPSETFKLILALSELAARCAFDPMALALGNLTVLFFWIFRDLKCWELHVLGIEDQNYTAGHGTAMTEGLLRRSVTFS